MYIWIVIESDILFSCIQIPPTVCSIALEIMSVIVACEWDCLSLTQFTDILHFARQVELFCDQSAIISQALLG